MIIKFDDLKREILQLSEKRLEEIRQETRGALAHQLKYIEEASCANEKHLNKNQKLVQGI